MGRGATRAGPHQLRCARLVSWALANKLDPLQKFPPLTSPLQTFPHSTSIPLPRGLSLLRLNPFFLPRPLAPAPRLQTRALSSSALEEGRAALIFDEHLKARQRERALWIANTESETESSSSSGEGNAPALPWLEDPLLESITDTLLDRLQDCTRKFPRALVLGGVFPNVLWQLNGRGGIQHATVVDTSPLLLQATQRAVEARLGQGTPPLSLDWVPAEPGRVLPVEPESFDVVLVCLGLHWHNDLPQRLLECRFALRPDGLFLGAMLGGDTLQELRVSCTLSEMERRGGVSPRTSPLAQVRDAGNLLTRAGLSLSAVDVDTLSVQYPSAVEVVEHLRAMGETNATKARNAALPRDTALAAAAIYQHMFSAAQPDTESGSATQPVTATYQVIFLSGWAPHSSQQAAKTRGSASVSLSELQRMVKDKNPQQGS